jgi:hypothetical protein
MNQVPQYTTLCFNQNLKGIPSRNILLNWTCWIRNVWCMALFVKITLYSNGTLKSSDLAFCFPLRASNCKVSSSFCIALFYSSRSNFCCSNWNCFVCHSALKANFCSLIFFCLLPNQEDWIKKPPKFLENILLLRWFKVCYRKHLSWYKQRYRGVKLCTSRYRSWI